MMRSEANRPALHDALAATRRGDALVVYSLSRLARSTRDTLEIADALDRRGADLVSLSEKIDSTSAAGRMIFRLLAVLAEFERDVISERTSMAMRHMQATGRFIGGQAPFGFVLASNGDLQTEVHTRITENPRSHMGSRGFSMSGTANAMRWPRR